jgi:hypothetical protein
MTKTIVPYFVSYIWHDMYSSRTQHTRQEVATAAADLALHVGAWMAAGIVDMLLMMNNTDKFATPARAAQTGAFATVLIAASVVVLLTGINITSDTGIETSALPASFTSLITGTARASAVFSVLAFALLGFQMLLIDALPSYTPTTPPTSDNLVMTAAAIVLKLFGVAATVNNHRLLTSGHESSAS